MVERALDLPPEVRDRVRGIAEEYESSSDLGDRETLVADSRYQYIEKVVAASVVKGQQEGKTTLTEKIDRVVTHRVFAIPLFLCTMLVMFVVTFGPFGSWLSDGVGAGIDLLGTWLAAALEGAGVSAVLVSLVCDGIIAGVGGVLTFLPQIALLFLQSSAAWTRAICPGPPLSWTGPCGGSACRARRSSPCLWALAVRSRPSWGLGPWRMRRTAE